MYLDSNRPPEPLYFRHVDRDAYQAFSMQRDSIKRCKPCEGERRFEVFRHGRCVAYVWAYNAASATAKYCDDTGFRGFPPETEPRAYLTPVQVCRFGDIV